MGHVLFILSLSIFSVISFLVSELTAAYIYIFFRRAITPLRNCWTAWLGGDSMAIFFFTQIGAKGEQLEFGLCFWSDLASLPQAKNDLGEIRWAVRSFFDFKVAIGGNFFFPRLGLVLLRGAIYSRSSDNKVITAKPAFPFYLKCLSNSSPLQDYLSLSGTSSIWPLWVTTLTYNLLPWLQRYVVISLFPYP